MPRRPVAQHANTDHLHSSERLAAFTAFVALHVISEHVIVRLIFDPNEIDLVSSTGTRSQQLPIQTRDLQSSIRYEHPFSAHDYDLTTILYSRAASHGTTVFSEFNTLSSPSALARPVTYRSIITMSTGHHVPGSYTFTEIAELDTGPELSALCAYHSLECLPPATPVHVQLAYQRRQLLLRILAEYYALTCNDSVEQFTAANISSNTLNAPEDVESSIVQHYNTYPSSRLEYATLSLQLPSNVHAPSDPCFDHFLTRMRQRAHLIADSASASQQHEHTTPGASSRRHNSDHVSRSPPVHHNSDHVSRSPLVQQYNDHVSRPPLVQHYNGPFNEDPPPDTMSLVNNVNHNRIRSSASISSTSSDINARFQQKEEGEMECKLRKAENARHITEDARLLVDNRVRNLDAENHSLRMANCIPAERTMVPVHPLNGMEHMHPEMTRLSVIESKLRDHQPIPTCHELSHQLQTICTSNPDTVLARNMHGHHPTTNDPLSRSHSEWTLKHAKRPSFEAFTGESGQSFRAWYITFLSRFDNVSPVARLELLSDHLRGPASTTWMLLPNETRADYNYVLAALLRIYDPPISRMEAENQFRSAKLKIDENETTARFLQRLHSLLQCCYPPMAPALQESLVMPQFRRGLPVSINKKLCTRFAGKSPSLAKMANAASDLLAHDKFKRSSNSSKNKSTAITILNTNDEDAEEANSVIPAQMVSARHVTSVSRPPRSDKSIGRWSNGKWIPPKRPVTLDWNRDCRNCLRPGHYAADCKQLCRYCGNPAHTSYNCRQFSQTPNTSRSSSPDPSEVTRK